jgi:hypothetical protein
MERGNRLEEGIAALTVSGCTPQATTHRCFWPSLRAPCTTTYECVDEENRATSIGLANTIPGIPEQLRH